MSDVKFNRELSRTVPLGKYVHKKGNEYEVIGYAKHSETCEDMIIYKALYGEGLTWVRPAEMFLDEGRFTYLGEEKAESRCGLHCIGCEWREPCSCGGCIETNGHPFHGECPVAMCVQSKGLTHCGECARLPCELLKQYSFDPEHGDNPKGMRIFQCRRWGKIK